MNAQHLNRLQQGRDRRRARIALRGLGVGRPRGGVFAALALLGSATAAAAAVLTLTPRRQRASRRHRAGRRPARRGARGTAAEPRRGHARRLRPVRQRDRALPRRVPEQGDVHAARHRIALAGGEPARPRRPQPGAHGSRDAAYAVAGLTGLVGTGFHLYNVGKRPGGFCWQNLFYAAPIGAPAALILSGLMGFLAERVRDNPPGTAADHLRRHRRPRRGRRGRRRAARARSAEAGLLHFRGALPQPVHAAAGHRPAGRRRADGRDRVRPRRAPRWLDPLVAADDRAARRRRRRASTRSASRGTWAAGATGARTS